ncbi:TPA: hypothetical protein EYO12_02145 [Candidatus Saccharibacteria bacterium]|nr:hypothetical protein [Candidatus Saccharibacteria bacterium]HIO87518.1 hypothetical protein [Candidatus Saccharibacteria bacterium]
MSTAEQPVATNNPMLAVPPFSEMPKTDLEQLAHDQLRIYDEENPTAHELVLAEASIELIKQELRRRTKQEILASAGGMITTVRQGVTESAKSSAEWVAGVVGRRVSGLLGKAAMVHFMFFDKDD